MPPILRKDDVLVAPLADVRRILLRVLAALPCQHGARVTILPIMIRRMPDKALPQLTRMVRCEVSSQRRWMEICVRSREQQESASPKTTAA